MTHWTLGILGGSGLYDLPGLEAIETLDIDTPWGAPSDSLMRGRLGETGLVFLPRHGRGHVRSPSSINYRANIDALKRAGCTDILSLSACGSLRETIHPGEFVAVDQFIDRTVTRDRSFFGEGLVAHVSMAYPVCARLAGFAADAAEAAGVTVHRSGTYLAMEGPQFSSLAESRLYRQWGCDVIGMTNMPEARLAREAELPYATLGMVTDYDCWHDEVDAVSVTNVLEVLHANAARARDTLVRLAERLAPLARTPSPQGIETCLDHALITEPARRDPSLVRKLDAVAGRLLNQH